VARFAIVICSVDRARLDECTARYLAAFAGEPFELIVIDDARSLAEGYNRGIARARATNVVFSHDDAFPISAEFADRVAVHLASVDIVGIAGATVALSGFWGYAGQRHTHGHVVAPSPKGSPQVDLLVWGGASRRVDGIRLLDGCMIAARREVASTVGFDQQRFDGFHLYDADFALRAHDAGCALSVVSDVTVFHRSPGAFDAEWHRYNERFLAVHASRLDDVAPQSRLAARVPFPDIATAAASIDERRIAELTGLLRDTARRRPGP
jgi:hypothetical protein